MKLIDLVKECVDLYACRHDGATELLSHPGIGKSTIVENDFIEVLSQHYGEQFGLVSEHLATRDAPDIGGYMVPSKRPDGTAVSLYTLPYIMERVDREVAKGHNRGILFLDEYGQSDHLVQKATANLLLNGAIGEWRLPEGWWVVLASNFMNSGAGVNKSLNHVINRKGAIKVDFDLDGLLRFAERPENNIHPMIMGWWQAQPGAIMSEIPKDGSPFSTPRSQIAAAKYIRQKMGDNVDSMHIPDDERTQEVVAGRVGDATAALMFAYFKVANEIPTWNEIITDPMTAKRPNDTRLDAQYAAMAMCTYYADATTVDPAFKYITRLAKELQTSAAKSLLEKEGGALLNSPELSSWIAKNKALIMATVSGS